MNTTLLSFLFVVVFWFAQTSQAGADSSSEPVKEDSTPAPAPTTTSPTPVPAQTPAKQDLGLPKTFSGKIVVADANAKVLKLIDASNETHIFKVTTTTKITVNGQDGKLGDMGPNMDVAVVPAEYPSNAETIVATGDAPAKKTYDFSRKPVFKSKKK